MDDREIIKLFVKKDEAAIKETDKKYRPYLFKIAMNILGNEADCEECINDAYMSVWNIIPKKTPDDLKLYLVRTVKNKALNVADRSNAEKRGGGQYVAALDELDEVVSGGGNPEESYLRKVDIQEIESFLDNMTELDRKMFIRRYWFWDAVADIARKYDVSVPYVNLRLHRVRKKLKKYLLGLNK